jgi:hypothetical protein
MVKYSLLAGVLAMCLVGLLSMFLRTSRVDALRHAIAAKDYAAVESILRSHPDWANRELRWDVGNALNCAVEIGDLRMVRIVLGYPCDVNRLSPSCGTPLQWASFYNRIDIVEVLLKAGADPNREGTGMNSTGFPLNSACRGGNYEIVRLLVEDGAAINVKDCEGRRGTPLLDALDPVPAKWEERGRIVEYLLKRGANVKIAVPPSMPNPSLLYWAGKWKVPATIVDMLKEYGAE